MSSVTFQIPIFPLPNAVFFPHTSLPLHIFEPRYRQMVADCLAGDKRLAMVLLKPGWEADYYGRPAVYEVAGAGEVVECETLADGRYNILLRGLERIGIDGEVRSEKLYRIATARWLPDVYPPEGEDGLTSQMDRLRLACGRLLSRLPRPVPGLLKLLTDHDRPGVLVDRIASVVVVEVEKRQSLLENQDVGDRIAEVTDYLEGVMALREQGDPKWQARWN